MITLEKYVTLGKLIKYYRNQKYRQRKSFRYTQRGILYYRCIYKNRHCILCNKQCLNKNKICSQTTLIKIEKGKEIRDENIYIDLIHNLGMYFRRNKQIDYEIEILILLIKNNQKNTMMIHMIKEYCEYLFKDIDSIYYQELKEIILFACEYNQDKNRYFFIYKLSLCFNKNVQDLIKSLNY